MWFIRALRIVFHENVPEKVLKISFSLFLDVLGGLLSLKSYFTKHA